MAVYAWGFGKLGQLGNGKTEGSQVPKEIKLASGDRAVQVVTGGLFTAVLTQKGDLFVCGCGKHGRLGTGSEEDVKTLQKVLVGRDVKIGQIAAGSWHACAVTYLGRLYTWGYNSKHNVLGRECDLKFSLEPGVVPSFLGITVSKVSCGHNFTLVSTTDGEVYSWGCGRYGVLGHGTEECAMKPKKIDSLDRIHIKSVNAGYAHCGAISNDGRLFMFGKGGDGALGLGSERLGNQCEPVWLQDMIGVEISAVSCSVGEHRGYTLALDVEGHVFCWGSNYLGKLGLGDQETRYRPCRIPQSAFDNEPVTEICAGAEHSAVITTDEGRLYTWGCGKDGRLGHRDVESTVQSYYSDMPKLVSLPRDKKAKLVSCSHYHTVLLAICK